MPCLEEVRLFEERSKIAEGIVGEIIKDMKDGQGPSPVIGTITAVPYGQITYS